MIAFDLLKGRYIKTEHRSKAIYEKRKMQQREKKKSKLSFTWRQSTTSSKTRWNAFPGKTEKQ